MGFEKKRDKKGTYIIANSTIFDEIISPLCPQLVFLSTLSTPSTSLRVNNIKKGEDKVKIGEDKKEERVKIMKIDVDDVDVNEMEGFLGDSKK